MDIAGVREALHNVPFRAFSLRLADGRSLNIPHPDFVALSRRHVYVVAQDNSLTMVEPLLIVSIDYATEGLSRTSGDTAN
jgi:hypothetical protein